MTVISGNEYCDGLYDTPVDLTLADCNASPLTWVGTIADGVAGTLKCSESGWIFESECDPLTDHPIELISCCPLELFGTANFTNFFGFCCEGEVELSFTAPDWLCSCDPYTAEEFSNLSGTFTDLTGDFVGTPTGTYGFAYLAPPGTPPYWHAEDVDGCCFGSLTLECTGDGFFLTPGTGDCFAAIEATTFVSDPFMLVFDVSVNVEGCVGTFQMTITL